MKKTLALFAIFTASTFAAEITGFVGDSMCGAKHVKGNAMRRQVAPPAA